MASEEVASELQQLLAFIKVLDQWGTAEVDLEGRGAHRLPDGGYLFQCQFNVSAKVPNADRVQHLVDILDGKPTEVIEVSPTSTGEQDSLGF